MPKKDHRWAALFQCREKALGREIEATDLSCEGCSYSDVPDQLYAQLVAFRHLNVKHRESAVRSYYGKPKSPVTNLTPEQLAWVRKRKRQEWPHIAFVLAALIGMALLLWCHG